MGREFLIVSLGERLGVGLRWFVGGWFSCGMMENEKG